MDANSKQKLSAITGNPTIPPSTVANGYPPPRPGRVTYTYGPPHPNPSGDQTNPNPDNNEDDGEEVNISCWFVVVLAVLAIGIIAFFFIANIFLWRDPQPPNFYITGFDVSSLDLSSSNSSLSGEFNLDFTVRNPNKKASANYDRVTAVVFYGGERISVAELPRFSQRKKETTDIKARLVADNAFIGDDAVNEMRADRGMGDNTVKFDARIVLNADIRQGSATQTVGILAAHCDDILVGFKSQKRRGAGSMVGPGKKCQVYEKPCLSYSTAKVSDDEDRSC